MGLQEASVTFGSGFEESFEPDEFYESFQAPKFHDFTAPEEPIDPDEFFMAQTGMVLKKAVVVEDVKTVAPKILKVTAQDVPKTAQGSPQLQAPPETPDPAEKTVRSSKNPCSFLLPLVMSNLKMLSSLSPFCTCWSPGLLREF
ncbi:hypothetical protein M758_5G088000 [Ceratodon purpureus]|nr:hypothetical protein M758_5G088000 [Ceratodon purpureus]